MTPLYLLLSPNLLGAPDLLALHTQREVADLCERQAAVEGMGGHESNVDLACEGRRVLLHIDSASSGYAAVCSGDREASS